MDEDQRGTAKLQAAPHNLPRVDRGVIDRARPQQLVADQAVL